MHYGSFPGREGFGLSCLSLIVWIRQEEGTHDMRCVAIIDDSMVVRKIVETSMSRAGIKCLSFRDGYEALRAMNGGLARIPDLLFLDICLPRIDGFDLLKLFKSNSCFDRMAIVMLSSRDGVLDRLKCRLAGARGYVVKPFRTQDLLAAVEAHLPATPFEAEDVLMRGTGTSFSF
jgi:twitching motility two-component system response regulator PilG